MTEQDKPREKRAKPEAGKSRSGKGKADTQQDQESKDVSAAPTRTKPVRIVAIGASAGGLEPIEQFFDLIPEDTGMAFVVVQHLSPNFQSMMDQLIERRTDMRVVHAQDGMSIEPDVIYLNPARTALSVNGGKLATKAYPDTEMLSLPIDAFFSSLADDAGKNAIGIVMSGTGSDGSKGSMAIVGNGGTVIAQEPTTAKFDSMPRKVIENDAATFTAEIKEMPEILDAILNGEEIERPEPKDSDDDSPENRILAVLQRAYGTDFRYYKKTTVNRRIQRRSMLKRYRNLEDYLDKLKGDQEELDTLYCDLLIGVTQFFRDSEAFEVLQNRVLPEIASMMSQERQLRIWVPGCATGEEAYSIAILISEFAKRNGLTLNLKIFATDIHFKSLEIAAGGIYASETIEGLPDDLADRYFKMVEGGYQVRQGLRRLIVFSPHNILKDPPFTRIDMVSCRNMLIYFNDIAQQRVLSLFHFALRKDGFLFLGASETLGSLDGEFTTIDKRWRIFSKNRDIHLREAAYLQPPENKQPKGTDNMSLRETRSGSMIVAKKEGYVRQALYKAYDRLLEAYAPTCLLVSRSGDLVHVFGEAERFLHVGKGVFSNRAVDLVHDDLRLVINAGVERCLAPGTSNPFERTLKVELSPGTTELVRVRIEALAESPSSPDFLIVTLSEKKQVIAPSEETPRATSEERDDQEFYIQRIAELESELKSTEESLQNTIEELETSNEELQATNEELMASNEELQSTNEELHSVNEELYTVSAEHQRKIAELTELTDDMENLLRSTQIGTIFLDQDLCIRRFTPAATRAFNLLPHDIGRPIDHVTYRFADDQFIPNLRKVMEDGKTINSEVGIEDQIYMLSLLPYRTELGSVTGVVVTIVDIQDLKNAEVELDRERQFYKTIVDTQSDLISRFTPDLKLTFVNQAFCLHAGRTQDELLGTSFLDLFEDADRESVAGLIDRLRQEDSLEWERREVLQDGASRWLHSDFRALHNGEGDIVEVQTVSRNVTDMVERENLVRTFSAITADSSRQLDDKFDDVLALIAKRLKVPMAMYLHLQNGDETIEKLVGIEAGRAGADKERKAKDETGRFVLHQALAAAGYTHVLGSTITVAGKLEGSVVFAASRSMPAAIQETIQPTIDRIADWIGYECYRQIQHRRLEDLNARLAEEEERYRKLYMDAPVIMHSVDESGKIIEVNRKWFTTLGYAREEVVGKPGLEFLTEDSQTYAMQKVLPEFRKHGYCSEVPYQMIKKNGEIIDIEMSVIAEQDREGKSISLATIIDVSDKLKAERELEAQNRELKNINENLNQFTHIVSHDLAGPLRAIQHTATWIEEDTNEEARVAIQEHIDRLKDQISHLGSLISDLTQYSRTGASLPDVERIALRAVLRDMFEVISETGRLKLDLSDVPEEIETYRAPLLLVLRNLVENAVKYHDKPGGSITVFVEEGDDNWQIGVKDDGPGIDPKYHKKILLPFRKLERKDKIPGNGMGLALVKKAVESVGGQIKVISDPSKQPGTTFLVTWPKDGQ